MPVVIMQTFLIWQWHAVQQVERSQQCQRHCWHKLGQALTICRLF